jgi:hypothetical protein
MDYSVHCSHLCFLFPVFCCSLVEIAVLLLVSWQSQANFSTGLQANTLWCLVSGFSGEIPLPCPLSHTSSIIFLLSSSSSFPMSPVAEDDIDIGTHTSAMDSQDSPLPRKFSGPMHRSMSSQSQSLSPSAQEAKCSWCGEYLAIPDDDDDGLSYNQVLKEHIATVHPHIAKFSMYDGAADEEPGDDSSHEGHEQPDELSALPENGEIDAAEDAEAGSGMGAEGVEDPTHEGDVAEKGEAEGDGDGDANEEESDQLAGFSHERDVVSVDKRLHEFWNIHDPREFSRDFDVETAESEKTWNDAFDDARRSKKHDASEFPDRPGPYRKQEVSKGEFLEITPLDEFLSQLRDPESRNSDELYAITQNAALALKSWQDEYMAIDKLYKRATRHTRKSTANPRKPERKELFEDKKESALYGYKHDPRADKVGNQNAFTQGGFKPTTTQMRKIITKAGPDNPNPDDWRPVLKFGVEHIPKLQDSPRKAPLPPKTTRKRKAAEVEAATVAEETDEPTESPAVEENPPKRRTRARGGVAEGFLPPPSRGTGRGRGRGRGAARMAPRVSEHIAPAPPSHTPALAAPVPAAAEPEPAPSTEVPDMQPVDALPDAAEVARRQKIANSKNPKRTEAMLNHWARFNREGRVRNPKRTKAQIEADRVADATKRAAEAPNSMDRKGSAVPVPPLGPAPPMQPAPMPSLAARGPIAPYAPIDPRAVAHHYGSAHGQQLQQPAPQMPYHSPYTEYYMNPYGAPPPQLPGGPRPT